MKGGRAYGKNLEYQSFCRDVLCKNNPSLEPYGPEKRKGLDVPISLSGTNFSFDIALQVPNERIVVGECRRLAKQYPVKQEDLASFAFKLDRLRRAQSIPVAGVFFAKSRYQEGAIKLAQTEGISMAIVSDDLKLESTFGIDYYRFNFSTGSIIKDCTIHVETLGTATRVNPVDAGPTET